MSSDDAERERVRSRFAIFLGDHQHRLRTYVSKRVRNDQHAVHDICQDTLLGLWVIWRDRGGLSDQEAIRLLYGIVPRRISDWYTKHDQRRPGLGDHELLAAWVCEHSEDGFRQVRNRLDAQALVSRLDPKLRNALIRVYVNGLSYGEAAQVLDITVSCLKKRLDQAKKVARDLSPESIVEADE